MAETKAELGITRAREFVRQLNDLCREAKIEVHHRIGGLTLHVTVPDGEDYFPLAHGVDGYWIIPNSSGWRNWSWMHDAKEGD